MSRYIIRKSVNQQMKPTQTLSLFFFVHIVCGYFKNIFSAFLYVLRAPIYDFRNQNQILIQNGYSIGENFLILIVLRHERLNLRR